MKILVTGSAGHLGEALMRTLAPQHDLLGADIKPSAHTQAVGSIANHAFKRECLRGVRAVLHTATLHKPHVATHTRQDFIDTNISGTLNLLEESVQAGVRAFVFTSTTSIYGHALNPRDGAPAVWVDEDLVPVPKNIYGVTKIAAESLCELVHRRDRLPCLILRTSRFFPEADDQAGIREAYDDTTTKANEYLYRRVEVDDVVSAPTRPKWCAATCPPTPRSTPGAAGRCSRTSAASTTTAAPGATSAGSRARISLPSSYACGAARTHAARWRG